MLNVGVTHNELVRTNYAVTLFYQTVDKMATDKTGAAGNQNIHKFPPKLKTIYRP